MTLLSGLQSAPRSLPSARAPIGSAWQAACRAILLNSRALSLTGAAEFFFSHLPLHPERGAFVDQVLTPAELALYRQPPRLRKDGVPWLDAARAAERCQLWQRAMARCDLNDGEAIRLEDVRGKAYLQK